jgi:predicted kinase
MAPYSARLVIVCGLPGSGKTTLAIQLSEARRAVRFSPDEWMENLGIDIWDTDARGRIEALQWTLAQDLLAIGAVNVVIDWGTWARSERDALRERGQQMGAAVELHYLDAPTEVLWNRILSRGLEARLGSRAMTFAEFTSCRAAFEAPTASELELYDVAEVHLDRLRH